MFSPFFAALNFTLHFHECTIFDNMYKSIWNLHDFYLENQAKV